MKRYTRDGGIPSLSVALSDYMNPSELKKLVSLTGSRAPARKEELVGLVRQYLDDYGLRTVWRSLDELQRLPWPRSFTHPAPTSPRSASARSTVAILRGVH